MNNCEYYHELISCMPDEELSEEESAVLKSHLDECRECRKVFEAFSDFHRILAGDMVDPPADLHDNIMAEIRRSEIKKKNRKLRPVFAAAACFAVVIIGALGLRSSGFGAKAASPAVMSAMAAVESDDQVAAEETPANESSELTDTMFAMALPAENYEEGKAESAPLFPTVPAAGMTSGVNTDSSAGELISLPDSESMDSLRALLSGSVTDSKADAQVLYTVYCGEDGSTMEICLSNGGICYFDSSDGKWHESALSAEECGGFLEELA